MEATPGVTAMLVSVGLVTVKVPVPDVVPEFAAMVEVPAATPAAKPVFAIVAAARFELDQVTVDVQLLLVLLE